MQKGILKLGFAKKNFFIKKPKGLKMALTDNN
jgi:hypothetical protein